MVLLYGVHLIYNLHMNSFNGYSLEAVIGMLLSGIIFTTIGIIVSISTVFKGEIATFFKYGENLSYKIKDMKPFKFWYFYALTQTLILGPGLFLLGFIGLFTFISTQILKLPP